MIKDKNGTEIKIGDRVHYKRPECRIQQGLREGYIKIISPQMIREVISKHRFN